MKLDYDHPEIETILSKIQSMEKRSKMRILESYKPFVGKLNFDSFISKDALKLIRELVQSRYSPYMSNDTTHWLNQIKGFDEDSIAQFVEHYTQDKNIGISDLSNEDYEDVTQALQRNIAEHCKGLTEIISRLNFR